jgi:mannose-1-phosphate guanylyltransferase/mannose-6-phosphate isomerase
MTPHSLETAVSPTGLDAFRVHVEVSLRYAMARIEKNTMGFLVVTDHENRVVGVLTDGDIRRALLNGAAISAPVAVAHTAAAQTVDTSADMATVASLFKDRRIRFVPVTDTNGKLLNIITRDQFNAFILEAGEFSATYNFLELDPTEEEQHIYPRPWGFYKTVFLNQHTRAKILCVYPEQALSLQYHHHREEHWMVVSGQGEVTLGTSIKQVRPGDYIFVPQKVPHRLRNASSEEMLMINEVQLGQAFDEEDIVRIDDPYQRWIGGPRHSGSD